MFERFTDRARRVVVLSQEEAKMLNHSYIGTEHILLGLIHEGEGVAATVLLSLGVGLDQVRKEVEDIIGQGQQQPTEHIPFTPRAKKALELAMREALQLGHNYIGTEHVLLGLIREGEGVAAQVLVHVGVDLGGVRAEVIRIILREVKASEERPPIVSRQARNVGAGTVTKIERKVAMVTLFVPSGESDPAVAELMRRHNDVYYKLAETAAEITEILDRRKASESRDMAL